MKILLIDPPTKHLKGADNPRAFFPLGLLSIASVLKKENYDVVIYDTKVSGKMYKNDGMVHFGDNWGIIDKKIRGYKPDVVGISNLFSSQFPNAIKVAQITKEVDKGIISIVGGPHGSVRPDDFLKEGCVDFVVMGEGEYTIIELLRHLREKRNKPTGINGISFRDNGKIIINERREFIQDLDSLPLPAFDLIDIEKYFLLQKKGFGPRPLATNNRAVSLFTSRGCPYNCVFCSIHLSMGKKFRAHSATYVLNLIDTLIHRYKVNFIHFEDDNFTFDKVRLRQILSGILTSKIKFKWGTPNGVRADTLDDIDLLSQMQEAGCDYLNIGIESGDQKVLDTVIDKRLDLNVVVNIAQKCRKLNLKLSAFFVVGFPGETVENIKSTVKFALMLQRKYNVFPFISYATPLIGTRLYDIALKGGYLTKNIDATTLLLATHHQGEALIKTEGFTPERLKKMVNRMHLFVLLDVFIKSMFSPLLLMQNIKISLRNPYIIKRYIFGY